ncbi:hypothetical protein P3W45_000815 [Vairimorpha bombi]|jgi:hypothetical protein
MKNHKKTDKVKKILEITKDNLNSILLELKTNKELLKLNIKNIVIFILKNYTNPEEILCKLRILYQTEEEEDIIDKIAVTVIKLTDNSKNIDDLFMLEYIINLDYFSRMFSLWYFDNKELNYEENCAYSKELLKIVYDTCKINVNEYIGDSAESERESNDDDNLKVVKENKKEGNISDEDNLKVVKENKKEGEFELIDLDDSEEIDRLDKQLGKIFYDKFNLSKLDKQKIAKICDIFDHIIVKNNMFKKEYYYLFINLVDIDDLLYKKIFKILRHSSDVDLFIQILERNKNIWRNINFIIKHIGMVKVFDCASTNELSTLEYLDRSLVDRDEFYKYILNNDFDLEKFETMIIHFLKKENDIYMLDKLYTRLKSYDENSDVLEYIQQRRLVNKK